MRTDLTDEQWQILKSIRSTHGAEWRSDDLHLVEPLVAKGLLTVTAGRGPDRRWHRVELSDDGTFALRLHETENPKARLVEHTASEAPISALAFAALYLGEKLDEQNRLLNILAKNTGKRRPGDGAIDPGKGGRAPAVVVDRIINDLSNRLVIGDEWKQLPEVAKKDIRLTWEGFV